MLKSGKHHFWVFVLLAALAYPAPASQAPDTDARQGEVRRLLDVAARLLPDMEDSPERGEFAANLAARQMDAGDLPGALATAKAVSGARARGLVISMIVLGYADKGDWKAALALVEKIEDPAVRSYAWRLLVDFHLRNDNPEAAQQLVAGFPAESAEQLFGFMVIADWYAKNGNRPEAERILGSVRELTLARLDAGGTRAEFLENSGRLARVGSRQIKFGNRAAGRETLETLRSRADKAPDEQVKEAVLSMVASAYAEAGETALALDALRELHGSYKDEVLNRVVMERSNAHDYGTALALAHDIGDSQRRDNAYSMIATSQAATGDEVGSRETLKLIADDFYRARALESIGGFLARKKPDQAAVALDQAERQARDVTDDRQRADVLARLTGDRSRLQDLDRALELALENPQPARRGSALENVLNSMAFWGETERAYRIAEEQTIPLVRAYAWMGIAEGLQNRIDLDRREAEKKASQ